MIGLIQNECLKLYKKKSTWVMAIAFLLFLIAELCLLRFTELNESMDTNTLFAQLMGMTSFLNLLVVIVASSIIAEEFSKGTVKLLLIRPHTRSSILLSKFLTVLIFGLIGTVALYVLSLITANAFFGFANPNEILSSFSLPAWQIALRLAGANYLLIVLYATITLLVSTVIRSQSLAVGVGLAFLFGSSVINSFLTYLMQSHEWLKWNIFNMMNIKNNITSTAGSGSNIYMLSFVQMALAIIIYCIIFYSITNFIFKKRDISLE